MQISRLIFASNLTCLAPSLAPSCPRPGLETHVKMSENTARNKEFWSERSASYDSGFEKTIAMFMAALVERRSFISPDLAAAGPAGPVRLLDYACGPGTVSRALYPYVTQCRGIDLAPGMVEKYKERAKLEGLKPEQMDAVEGDLHAPSSALDRPDLRGFDVAAVGFGAHHFDDPTAVAARLVERLRPGGALFIADLLPYERPAGGWGDASSDHHHHHHHHHGQGHHQKHGDGGGGDDEQAAHEEDTERRAARTVARNGFDEAEVRRMFEAAGAGEDFRFEIMESIEMPQRDKVLRTVFFARGTKPAAAAS
ncbi:hypothetical protein RB597_005547 [Gaeumannomyces tritici]